MKKHVCPKCKVPKPVIAKHWYRNSRDPSGFGLQKCKACVAKYEKARYIPATGSPAIAEDSAQTEPGRVPTVPEVSFDERASREELAATRVGCGTISIFRPINVAIPIT